MDLYIKPLQPKYFGIVASKLTRDNLFNQSTKCYYINPTLTTPAHLHTPAELDADFLQYFTDNISMSLPDTYYEHTVYEANGWNVNTETAFVEDLKMWAYNNLKDIFPSCNIVYAFDISASGNLYYFAFYYDGNSGNYVEMDSTITSGDVEEHNDCTYGLAYTTDSVYTGGYVHVFYDHIVTTGTSMFDKSFDIDPDAYTATIVASQEYTDTDTGSNIGIITCTKYDESNPIVNFVGYDDRTVLKYIVNPTYIGGYDTGETNISLVMDTACDASGNYVVLYKVGSDTYLLLNSTTAYNIGATTNGSVLYDPYEDIFIVTNRSFETTVLYYRVVGGELTVAWDVNPITDLRTSYLDNFVYCSNEDKWILSRDTGTNAQVKVIKFKQDKTYEEGIWETLLSDTRQDHSLSYDSVNSRSLICSVNTISNKIQTCVFKIEEN